MPFSELDLVANRLRVRALTWGSRGGPVVVLVHGFPDTPHGWDVIGQALAESGAFVVAPFLRGYAPSEAGAKDTTTRDLGEDVIGLVAALGVQRVHLVGHDWGAESAYAAVALAPEAFHTLTTIAIPHRATLTPTPQLAWAIRHFVTLSLPGAEARFAKHDFAMMEELITRWSPTWKFSADELAPIKACFREPGTVHAALGYYRAAALRTPDFMAKPVTVPTLNIAGTDDPGVRPAAFESTRRHYLAGFEVLTVPGGHFCHRESPEPVIAALRRQLRASLQTTP
ncbi:MAG: alpha/beta hydrolase [Myxococcales bacterium]|nr:alpha/beta hydrolase [Myxococcales bacterium]